MIRVLTIHIEGVHVDGFGGLEVAFSALTKNSTLLSRKLLPLLCPVVL